MVFVPLIRFESPAESQLDIGRDHRQQPAVKPVTVHVDVVALVVSFQAPLDIDGADDKKLRSHEDAFWQAQPHP